MYPEIEIIVRWKRKKYLVPSPILATSAAIVNVLRNIINRKTQLWREEVWLLCHNRSKTLLGYHLLAIGGMDASIVDTRTVATVAVKSTASGVVLAHNHPAGTLHPSSADIVTTDRIKRGLRTLDLQLTDHLIVTESGYYSFRDDGML